jgi:hypothetical protein
MTLFDLLKDAIARSLKNLPPRTRWAESVQSPAFDSLHNEIAKGASWLKGSSDQSVQPALQSQLQFSLGQKLPR